MTTWLLCKKLLLNSNSQRSSRSQFFYFAFLQSPTRLPNPNISQRRKYFREELTPTSGCEIVKKHSKEHDFLGPCARFPESVCEIPRHHCQSFRKGAENLKGSALPVLLPSLDTNLSINLNCIQANKMLQLKTIQNNLNKNMFVISCAGTSYKSQ